MLLGIELSPVPLKAMNQRDWSDPPPAVIIVDDDMAVRSSLEFSLEVEGLAV